MTSRTKLKNEIYRTTFEFTSKRYSDDYWKGVKDIEQAIIQAMDNLGTDEYDFYIYTKQGTGGYRTSDDGMNYWKEYEIVIFTKEDMKEQLIGHLNCHSAGTFDDPFLYYDMSLSISFK